MTRTDASGADAGSARAPEAAACDHEAGCITCGDQALEMRVVRVDEARGLALCEAGDGARASVEVALVAPVAEGEVLLVHAGTAIASPARGASG